MKIGKKKLGREEKAFVVAEVGQAHDGSVGYAHSFIDIASQIGVDAIKFQAHFASEESTRDEKFRVNFSYVDKDRYDYWKRMEFSPSQLKELKDHSESVGLEFICTPFSNYAIDVLQELGIKVWKIGSGESSSTSFIEKIATTKKPDAIICIGWVIKHETDHYFHVANQTALGIAECASSTGIPTIFGVLTTLTEEQAIERSKPGKQNKGYESAEAAIKAANVIQQL